MLYKASADLMAAASPALLARGVVNVVGLDGLKDQAGQRWTRIREGVYARIESLLRQRLGPTDFFVRIDETAYLITMPASEPEDVNVVCLRVAYDLYREFLGQCDLGRIQVSSASNGADNTLILKQLAFEQVIALADKAGIQDFNMAPSVGVPLARNQSDRQITGPGVLISQPGMRAALRVEHQFEPVWAVSSQAITTYICQLKAITAPERQLSLSELSPRERVVAELSCLNAGIAQLSRSIMQGSRFLLGVEVSFDVLGSPQGRMEFLAACHGLSHSYRQYILFIITEVPPGVAQTRLSNLVNTVKPFARGVWATVAPHPRVLGAYQGIGLRGLGFDMREFSLYDPLRLDEVEQLVFFARKNSLSTFLGAVQNTNVLKFAQDTNIQHLSGPVIAVAEDEPPGMRRLTWDKFMPQSFVELWI